VAYLTEAENMLVSPNPYTIYAFGGDVFYNKGPITFQAEYDNYKQDTNADTTDINGSGWYAQAGFLFLPKVELAVRYQELDPTKASGDKIMWTTIGLNYYWHSQKLKIAADYTFKSEEEGNEITNNLFQIQLQLDF